MDWGLKPFRFFNHWMKHPSLKLLVESKLKAWNIHGWGGYMLKEKLKRMKAEIKTWKEQNFGKIDLSIEKRKDDIYCLDVIDDAFGFNTEKVNKRSDLINELLAELKWNDSSLFQKSCAKWIVDGDCNSKLFHSFINKRNKRNEIIGLWSNNSSIDSVSVVKKEVFNHV
ncbi:hypothetical protein ACS0TY_032722 [Phlomoides rotata]